MNSSRQPQLLWNFIVAYKQATGNQLSYVNLSRNSEELKQALMQARQIRDSVLHRSINELENTLPEISVTDGLNDEEKTVSNIIREPSATERQNYLNLISSLLQKDVISLEQRQSLDEYCLEHGINWSLAETLERQYRAKYKLHSLSWRDEFKRSLAVVCVRGHLAERDRLRLYNTYIKRERLTAAESEILTVEIIESQRPKIPFYQNHLWGSSLAAIAGIIVAFVLGLPWLAPVYEDGGLSSAIADRENNASIPMPNQQKPMLRIHGSNTLGAHLIPALAELYLGKLGNSAIKRTPGEKDSEINIHGRKNKTFQLIEIHAHGSGTAFTSLAASKADLGASSRPIKDKELELLKDLGDLTGLACEHVIALDGVAVIVHPSNPIMSLSKEQIELAFSGKVKDWSDFGGTKGPIQIHARDDKSGTYDTFTHLVMGKSKIDPQAKRYESNDVLSDQVATDPTAIGFTSLPAVRSSKALAVSDGGHAIFPTRFTIATEDYPLSRRLFLYSSTRPTQATNEFLQLVFSDVGQSIIAQIGFVDLRPELQTNIHNTSQHPNRYLQFTENAKRLSLNFRFRANSDNLDNKAQKDLARLVTFLSSVENNTKKIMLLGFSDDTGSVTKDQQRSNNDASVVATALQMRGIYPSIVEGFGSALPLANNIDPAGRIKNRRVEIWMQ